MRPLMALAALAALAASACSMGGTNVDGAAAERAIIGQLTPRYEPYELTEVVCPRFDRSLDEGEAFECTGRLADQVMRFAVIVTDGDTGDVLIRPIDAVLSVAEAEMFVSERLLARFELDVTLDCGRFDPIVVGPQQIFDCSASVAGQQLQIGFSVESEDGAIDAVLRDAVIDLDELESRIASDALDDLGASVGVECGVEALRVATVGSSFDCVARSEQGSLIAVRVAVTDAEGRVEWRLLG